MKFTQIFIKAKQSIAKSSQKNAFILTPHYTAAFYNISRFYARIFLHLSSEIDQSVEHFSRTRVASKSGEGWMRPFQIIDRLNRR